jgi:hypothetical protein
MMQRYQKGETNAKTVTYGRRSGLSLSAWAHTACHATTTSVETLPNNHFCGLRSSEAFLLFVSDFDFVG